MEKKRRTSTEVQRRHIESHYDKMSFWLDKDTAARFRAAVAANGGSMADVLKRAVKEYLREG